MPDIFSSQKRSWIMSRVKNKDTSPELLVRKSLHREGFRFRLHIKDLPGNPDIVLKKYSTLVFIHGCFWHGHNCKRARLPQTNKEYWKNKIESNMERRDKANVEKLKELNWNVFIIWTCSIEYSLMELIAFLKNRRDSCI